MLSISKPMSVKQADRYFKADDYYLSEKGEWQGLGAAALGLSGSVEREDFRAVLTGKHPDSGEALLHRSEKTLRGGIDLTFSAPKGVSVLSLADPVIKTAHQDAVKTVIEYLEKHYSHTREQVAGVREVSEHSNLAVAKFTHMVSRSSSGASDGVVLPDPQLHTHAFVVNLIRTDSDKWKAHHNDAIYKDQLQLGRFYRSELAANLRELGYAIEVVDDEKYLWDVKGVPEAVRDEFSKRRRQIEERTEELRASGEFDKTNDAALREIANMQTRLNKGKVSPKELMEYWKASLAEKGHSLEGLQERCLRETTLEKSERQKEREETPESILLHAAEVKTTAESVFTKAEILDLSVRLSPPGSFRLGELEQAFSSLSASGEFPLLGTILQGGKRGTPIPRQAFTTNEMQKIEREILDLVQASKNKFKPLSTPAKIDLFLNRKENESGVKFTGGQRELARVVLASSDRVNIVQGDAGSGKTAGLSLVREFAESRGIRVAGLGFTGKAAEELKKGAAIESSTLDSFLHSKAKDSLPSGSILILDEASMAGSRHFHSLLKLAEAKSFKVAIVGDKKQFQSISAGRNHAILQELADVDQVRMNHVLRQTTKAAKDLVKAIAEGRTNQALELLSREGSLKQISNRKERLDFVVSECLNLRKTGTDVLVLTGTNSDRIELNQGIRNALISARQLKRGREFQTLEPAGFSSEEAAFARNYKPGQKIVFLKDVDDRIKAGGEATIVSVDPGTNSITVQGDGKSLKQKSVVSLKEHHQSLSVYNAEKRFFAPGDRIVFLRNDKALGVKNGLQGIVKHLDKRGNITVETEHENEIRFRLSDNLLSANSRSKYNHLAHAYALTEYKSQGATTQAVIWHADASKGNANRNSFYVAATRAKETVKVVTDDKEALKKLVAYPQEKTSTLELGELGKLRDRDIRQASIRLPKDSPECPSNKNKNEIKNEKVKPREMVPKIESADFAKERQPVQRDGNGGREKQRQIERTR